MRGKGLVPRVPRVGEPVYWFQQFKKLFSPELEFSGGSHEHFSFQIVRALNVSFRHILSPNAVCEDSGDKDQEPC